MLFRSASLGCRLLSLGSRQLGLCVATSNKIFAGIVTTILAHVIATALPCRRHALRRRPLALGRDNIESDGRHLALGGRLLTLGCRGLAMRNATSLKIFAGIITTIITAIVTTIAARVIATALLC